MWIDIEAGEFGGLSSARFFEMAERLSAYSGVVAARIRQEQEQQQRNLPPGAKIIGSSRGELELNPATAGLFD